MKVRASVKKISPDDKIVWRGRGKGGKASSTLSTS